MLKFRLLYLVLLLITIVIGVMSRQFGEIPMFVGDVLWGLTMFLFLKIIFMHAPLRYVVIASLVISYLHEFSQLYKAPWIDNLRLTFLGTVLLGETFLWGDMISYTVGIALGMLVELSIRKMQSEEVHMTI